MRSRKHTSSRTAALGLLVAFVLVLASCSSSSDDTTTTTAAEATETTVAAETTTTAAETTTTAAEVETPEVAEIRMTWWGNPERDEKTIAMIDAFMVAYPNITVNAEPTVFDGYFDKLAVGFAGGDAPDVVTLGGSYPTEYGVNGALLDLTEYAEASGLDQFSEASVSQATVDGAVYGIPTGGNARGLLINLDMFAAAGIDLPDDDTWTWDEYVTLMGALTDASGGEFVGTDWRIQEVKEEFAAQRGAGKEMYLATGGIGVDVATMTELFDIPVALLANGGMPSAEETVELTETTMEMTLFGQGKAATMFGYSNNVQNFADILGVGVDMIKIPGEGEFAAPGLTVLPSQFFGVWSGTEFPDAAALLLDWMLSQPEPGKIILSNRGLSFNPTVLEAITPLLGEYEALSAAYLQRIAADGRGALPQPLEGKGEVDDVTLRLQDDLLFGNITAADAAQQWIDEATAIIP